MGNPLPGESCFFWGFLEANGEQSRSNLEEPQASKKLASDAWKNSRCHMSEDPVRQRRSIAQTPGLQPMMPLKNRFRISVASFTYTIYPLQWSETWINMDCSSSFTHRFGTSSFIPSSAPNQWGFQHVFGEFTSPCNKWPPDHVRSWRSVANQRRASATWSDPGCKPRTHSHARPLLTHQGVLLWLQDV